MINFILRSSGALAASGLLFASVAMASSAGVPPAGEDSGELVNIEFGKWMLVALGAFAGIPLIYRFVSVIYCQVRLMASLGLENQTYFSSHKHEWVSWLKINILYAPFWKNRHNRELQISRALDIGTLPTRFESFFLIGYVVGNIIFSLHKIDWDGETTAILGEIRNRTGVLSTVNLVPLFLLAGRNNPLIQLMGISFDTYNLVHRWLGRIVVTEAFTHSACWAAAKVMKGGWAPVGAAIQGSVFIQMGFVGTCAFVFLMCHSPSSLRHAFYETFLFLHIVAAAVALGGLWVHLDYKKYRWLVYVKIAIALWVFDRSVRLFRIIYRNIGKRMTTATVEILPGEAIRVTLKLARPWKFRAGQHVYLYVPSVGLWTSHPFTIAWGEQLQQNHKMDDERLSFHRQDLMHIGEKTMSLVIRRRTGFTNALFNKADATPNKVITLRALAEGPYGKVDSLASYGTVVLVAGGVGITHPVPHIRDLVEGYAKGTVATKRIVLVWVVQSPEHLEWIRPWMTDILAMERRREVLEIQLFVTRPSSTKAIHSPSATVQMFPGRPNIDTILDREIDRRMGTMGVTVCGSGSLSDDVRRAVRTKMDIANIDFIEEAFSW
ncbi:ferric reductase NAD binding domain-containing protein [Morchella snyderi]|nr:ferric reductase NAD binding domain-containing protein [Morchella snyderi]